MQLPQERQPRRRLAVEQHNDHREVMLLHAAVERLVVFHYLPRADALLANQQDEDRRLGDRTRKLREPQASGPQAFRRKENPCVRVLGPERLFEALEEPQILRIVTEKPAPHSKDRVCARGTELPMTCSRKHVWPLAMSEWQDIELLSISQRVRSDPAIEWTSAESAQGHDRQNSH
jgi:hypothetical protein